MAGTTLGTAYVQIMPSAKGISGSISNVLGGEAESAGTDIGGKIASFAKKAIAGAAIGKVLKDSLLEGAKLEQSFGGLDTLYGDAAQAAKDYAKEAAAAGISMNDYAEQAVSFGAALKAAYGGDTKAAADAANTAILDMADNAAKMGTPLESIQQAYQGFARGQYVLLDNLRLGYGGTRGEMERLLSDAQEISGVEYNIDNLGDVYDAIHVIQGELQLTGVAAGEAETTFSGSFNAMKAAAQNFLGSLSLGKGVNEAMSQLATSASTFFFGNFLPMIGTLIKSLPGAILTFIQQGIPMLLSGLGTLVSGIADNIASFASNISSENVSEWATNMLPKMLEAADSILGSFLDGLVRNFGKISLAIGKIGLAIVKGLGSALWGKVKSAAEGIKDRFLQPINTLRDKVKGIIDKIKGFFKFKVSAPHIPLPHFSISPAGWKVGDLLKGVKPSLSIKWFAEGGIVDSPTLFGAGEAGPEAIMPLSKLESMFDTRGTTINNYITVNGAEDPELYAQQFARELRRQVRMGTI